MFSNKKIIIISVLSIFLIFFLVGFSIYRNYEFNKYINLANISLKSEDFDEATGDYQLAKKYNSRYDYKNSAELKQIEVCENEIIQGYLDLAKKNIQQQDYSQAIIYLNIALKVQPNNQDINKLYFQCKEIIAKIYTDAKTEQEATNAKTKAYDDKVKAEKSKTEGVRIGMTQQEVLGSMWRKPYQINKTTSASGVSEQWVYGYNSSKMSFLYFDNGILTTIQN